MTRAPVSLPTLAGQDLGRRPPKARRPKTPLSCVFSPVGWTITNHVCGACYGRVLYRAWETGEEFRCADCGNVGRAAGPGLGSMCACGTRFAGVVTHKRRDAGIRCIPNPLRSPERPWEIIARDAG